jgi:hypothetical protein
MRLIHTELADETQNTEAKGYNSAIDYLISSTAFHNVDEITVSSNRFSANPKPLDRSATKNIPNP